MMNKQNQLQNPAMIWLSFAVRMTLFAIALMWPAGTWRWWEAWVLVGLWTVFGIVMTIILLRHDPALLAERLKLVPLHKEQKDWDKVLMLLFFRLYPGFAMHDHYLWSGYIAITGVFILYEISMECAQEYPHPQRSSKSCQRMRPMYGTRWLCS